MTRYSVCMATYNGQRFLDRQMTSILAQLGPDDEVVVVDDGSSDGTVDMLRNFGDPRITLLQNPQNMGVNATFERAMAEARGDVIFLSDQDDVWLPGRLEFMAKACQRPGIDFVVTNYSVIDAEENVIGTGLAARLHSDDDHHTFRNVVGILSGKMNYYGCAMAMTARFRDVALPFPPNIECHDLWLAMIANISKTIAHLEEDSLAHRVHGKNASIVQRPLLRKVLARIDMLHQILLAWKRRSKLANRQKAPLLQ
jgi:glycosyltransferase involved in cell wall biosynthesis